MRPLEEWMSIYSGKASCMQNSDSPKGILNHIASKTNVGVISVDVSKIDTEGNSIAFAIGLQEERKSLSDATEEMKKNNSLRL